MAVDERPNLIDLLGAMAHYYDLRNNLADKRAESDDYSFDYYHTDEINDLERAYERVQDEWMRVFSG